MLAKLTTPGKICSSRTPDSIYKLSMQQTFLLALFIGERCFSLNDSQQPAALCYSKCTAYKYRWGMCWNSATPKTRAEVYALSEDTCRNIQDAALHFIELSVQSSGKTFLCILCHSEIDTCTLPQDQAGIALASMKEVTRTSFSFWRIDPSYFECRLLKYPLSASFLLPSDLTCKESNTFL